MSVIRLAQNLAVVHEHCIQPFVSLETWTLFSVRAGLIISLLESPCAIKLVIKQTHNSREHLIYIKKSSLNLDFCLVWVYKINQRRIRYFNAIWSWKQCSCPLTGIHAHKCRKTTKSYNSHDSNRIPVECKSRTLSWNLPLWNVLWPQASK